METSPSPAAFHDTGRAPRISPGTVCAALLVPVVAVLGVVTSWDVQVIHQDWVDKQQEACRLMARPLSEYVTAWAGPALGVAAVLLCVLLAKRIRRRYGLRIWETWPGLAAYIVVWFNVLAILLELFTLWATFTPDGSGSILGDCE
ncbi:hypothetical protein AB0I68_38365 [Streptomyces sp. NPDC050448]|uniref:hypothetical protein n=1 Tax=Streptomyces sp. NPDC050448 TaxID=3155404 RepID=UPI0034121931